MKTIAWDVDDVLNDLMRAWLTEKFLRDHPGSRATYEAITANPPHEVLGVPLADYLASLDAFRAARQTSLAPCPEILAWLSRRGDGFRHVAVTATPLRNAHRSTEWVIRHFGRWIRTVTVLPSRRDGEELPVYDATKADHLAWLGKVDVLVDDTPKNVEGLAGAGARPVLVPRPWNGRAGSIADALAELDALLG
jgi:hypothetical protein